MMVMAGMSFDVWSRIKCREKGYIISEESHKEKRLLAERDRLIIEIESLKSPLRISHIAEEKLKLFMPKPSQMIVIEQK